ncbi:MAG: hypothetical protein KF729_37915 [Sandaracinaceae bacterium]|nr:hypothetical protein [Sandaracinaceae bacterium]
MSRADLRALDEARLAELATRGDVRRAARELAAGRTPALEELGDGTVVALTDGVTTRLAPGRALAATECSCGAARVCHHRVLAVLAYRAREGRIEVAPWSPAAFDDAALEARLGAAAWRRARERRSAGYLAHVTRGALPSVELTASTVRFLVPAALEHARCDCAARGDCEHVALAVWAFTAADAVAPDAPRASVEVGPRAALDLGPLEPALALARELLSEGIRAADAALASRVARARAPLEAAGWCWPLAVCAELEANLSAYAARDAAFDASRAAALLTELLARARAAARPGALPARAVLGAGEPDEVALEPVRLVALGARLAQAPDDARVRADVFLADPDTGAVLVLSHALAASGAAPAAHHVCAGLALGALASGQLVARGARRRADHALHLAAARRGLAHSSVTPQRGDWDRLATPRFVPRVAALARALRDAPPALLAPRRRGARVHALAVSAASELAYDPGAEVLHARLHDPEGGTARLRAPRSAAAPHALDALARALAGPVRFVSGEIHREGEALVITPLAVVTDRVIVPDLEPPGPLLTLRRASEPPPLDPLHARLDEARALLDRLAHAGLAHASRALAGELAGAAARLSQASLTTCAARTQALADALTARDDPRALAAAWLDASLRVRLALEAG